MLPPALALSSVQAALQTLASGTAAVTRAAVVLALLVMLVTTATRRAQQQTRRWLRATIHTECVNRPTTLASAMSPLEVPTAHRQVVHRTVINEECVTVLRVVVASLVTSVLLAKACVLVVIRHLVVESIVAYVMLQDNAHVTQASSASTAQKRAQRQSLEYATVKVIVVVLVSANARRVGMEPAANHACSVLNKSQTLTSIYTTAVQTMRPGYLVCKKLLLTSFM